ncbi:MAG: hypothetical protein M1814_003825 [Vezdaea aestivalis]|nr:MAG: hypothetical protein M1814_003825 [Vezdaea aestivalis]
MDHARNKILTVQIININKMFKVPDGVTIDDSVALEMPARLLGSGFRTCFSTFDLEEIDDDETHPQRQQYDKALEAALWECDCSQADARVKAPYDSIGQNWNKDALPPKQFMCPRLTSRYEIVKILGSGAYGGTYVARRLKAGNGIAKNQLICIKFQVNTPWHQHMRHGDPNGDNFEHYSGPPEGEPERWFEGLLDVPGRGPTHQEAFINAYLHKHPNIPRMYECYLHGFGTFIVSELVCTVQTGDSFCSNCLYRTRDDDNMEWNEEGATQNFLHDISNPAIAKITYGILNAMYHLEKSNVTYTDLNEKNILVDQRYNVYIIDFAFSTLWQCPTRDEGYDQQQNVPERIYYWEEAASSRRRLWDMRSSEYWKPERAAAAAHMPIAYMFTLKDIIWKEAEYHDFNEVRSFYQRPTPDTLSQDEVDAFECCGERLFAENKFSLDEMITFPYWSGWWENASPEDLKLKIRWKLQDL